MQKDYFSFRIKGDAYHSLSLAASKAGVTLLYAVRLGISLARIALRGANKGQHLQLVDFRGKVLKDLTFRK